MSNKQKKQLNKERKERKALKAKVVIDHQERFRQIAIESLNTNLSDEDLIEQLLDGGKHHHNKYKKYSNCIVTTPDFKEFFKFIHKKSDLLDSNFDYSKAIFNIYYFKDKWIRDYKQWKAPSHNHYRQFHSFIRYLFCKYPDVPEFVNSVWHATDFVEIFIHLGNGGNVRDCKLPIRLSKKQVKYFLNAPKDFSIKNALRYAQIMNIGGNERLVREILKTRIAEDFNENRDPFWLSVFKFFIDNPMLDINQYGPLIDYINDQKYGEGEKPNFSMKDRSPETLMKNMEEWHKRLSKIKKHKITKWESSGYKGYIKKEKKDDYDITYEIKELLTQSELSEEGKMLKHCVSSYGSSCANGSASIWSLSSHDSYGNFKKLITIEVRNSAICQARGRFNRKPDTKESNIIALWAKKVGFALSKWIL